jgi:hypothetical protein
LGRIALCRAFDEDVAPRSRARKRPVAGNEKEPLSVRVVNTQGQSVPDVELTLIEEVAAPSDEIPADAVEVDVIFPQSD